MTKGIWQRTGDIATVFGKVDKFDGSEEEWTQYVECLGHFFVANDITDAGKKRAVLLSVVEASTYALLMNLVSPAKPGDISHNKLNFVAVLQEHYNPTPSETISAQQYSFRTSSR